MGDHHAVTFQEALEVVESLSVEQQEHLIDVVRRRLIESRRDELAKHVKEAREEYQRGQVRRGSVDDLLNQLSE